MRKEYLTLTVSVIVVFLSYNYSFCDGMDYDEAKIYILRVFNGSYIIKNNKMKMKHSLTLDKCNINFSYTIDGNISEQQSCSMNDLDHDRIVGGNGEINIWTINEERRVTVSSLKNKYWTLALNYDPTGYSDEKIMASLKKVLSECNKEEGAGENGTSQAKATQKNTNGTGQSLAPSGIPTRQAFASIYNRKLTDQGLAHSVFSTGDDHSTLLINKFKMSEKLINGITRDRAFLSKLRGIGFNEIKFCEPSFQNGSNCQAFSLKD